MAGKMKNFTRLLYACLFIFIMNNPYIFTLISKFTASNKKQIDKDGFIYLYIR
ncbi:hypothetical protein SPHINGO8BC_51248 [Sphingobacterium multivorum]|uniref:Uncharacterized protein n=1 Tax=Sphingobacterium multivorum TaxID=28454 RepID=A0A654CVN2_SPHMU|nr:hypothetical protein SPHINGO8BC_51248 [Sphingobacterium multivorum]